MDVGDRHLQESPEQMSFVSLGGTLLRVCPGPVRSKVVRGQKRLFGTASNRLPHTLGGPRRYGVRFARDQDRRPAYRGAALRVPCGGT